MSDTDSLDYLQADFDPNSLTVPRLRSILVNYDISYPSTAKKPQLIEIFNDQILPQRKKILRDRDHARRSSRGITNADSREVLDNDEDLRPLTRSPRKSIRKTSTKVRLDENAQHRGESTRGPIKTPRANSKHARASDTETGTDVDTRRRSSRKARSTDIHSNQPLESPGTKYDILDDGAGVKIVKRRESAFTYDNPFQSGSSPLAGFSSPDKRKSLGASATKERRRTSGFSSRRKTDVIQLNHGIHPPSRSIFEAPPAVASFKGVDENDVEIGEEFTPEEQLELSREGASTGSKNPDSPRPKSKQPGSINLKGPIWVVLITLLGSYLAWYRQEKIAVGYCGVGRDSSPLLALNWQVPKWARVMVEPECEPCPQHAYCSDGMNVECEHDYILKGHPLSLAGVIPLAPTCEADGAKARKVTATANRAVEMLRDRRAEYECGSLKNEATTSVSSPKMDANDLKNEVSKSIKSRRREMTQAELNELWASATVEISKRDEIVSETDGIHTKFSSNSLARLPLSCSLRRSIRKTLAEYRLQIGGIVIIILFLLYVRSILISRQMTNAAIPQLVSLTLERLANLAALHQENSDLNPWISIGQLRDDVLRDEHSITKREKIWRKVRSVVEMNANVRCSQKEDRNGEVSRVWEWIGAVESIEEKSKRRESGRVNLGGSEEFDARASVSKGSPFVTPFRPTESRPFF